MTAAATSAPARLPDALSPTWLLRPPQPLATAHDQPLHKGQPLRLISGPQRVETGWWADALAAQEEGGASPEARERAGRYVTGSSPRQGAGRSGSLSSAGSSAACEAGERGGSEPPPDCPKAASAPLGGSGPRAAEERGGHHPAAGPLPRRGAALSGGSGPRAAGERGGHEPPPGRPKAASAPSGGSAAGEAAERGGQQVSRDYFIAQSATAELLWIYRERPTAADMVRAGAGAGQGAATRWFLHGLYA